MVVCDVVDTAGAPVEVSPRQILRRQVERAPGAGPRRPLRHRARVLPVPRDLRRGRAAQGWRDLHPHVSTIEDYQLLQTSREEYVLRRIRNEMVAADIPVEFSKGEAGRGQHEVNVTYGRALEVADRHLVFKNGVKEIADQCGRSATFMAKWSMDEVGSSCHIHASLWDAASGAPLMWGRRRARRSLSADGAAVRGRAAPRRPPADLAVGALRQLVQALRARDLGAHGRGVGRRQPHLRVPPGRARGEGRRVECRIPGADVNPYLALAGHLRRRPVRRRARPRAGRRRSRQRLRRHRRAPRADDPGRGHRASSRRRRGRRATPSATTSTTTCSTRPARSGRAANQTVTDWELARNFERI